MSAILDRVSPDDFFSFLHLVLSQNGPKVPKSVISPLKDSKSRACFRLPSSQCYVVDFSSEPPQVSLESQEPAADLRVALPKSFRNFLSTVRSGASDGVSGPKELWLLFLPLLREVRQSFELRIVNPGQLRPIGGSFSEILSVRFLTAEDPEWQPDEDAPAMCPCCGVRFSFVTRKSHCRLCGKVFCRKCVDIRYLSQRCCPTCFSVRPLRTNNRF